MPDIRNLPSAPATQKATGVWVLARKLLPLQPQIDVPACHVARTKPELSLPFYGKPHFARPCPQTPRHGFVDSRPVASLSELQQLWTEARAADPKAELLIMPVIAAGTSAIYVAESGMLAFGAGHDGATGGKRSLSLPVAPVDKSLLSNFRTQARIAPGDDTYIELVYDASDLTPYAVQARSGLPVAGGMTEYIPHPVTVAEVIRADQYDWSAWEQLMPEIGKKEADLTYRRVAWQPGGTLASHYAIHAKAAGVPFLTRKEQPELGIVLHPPDIATQPFIESEYAAGVTIAQQLPRQQIAEALRDAIAVIHNSTYLQVSPAWSRLYGYAVATIFKAAALCCIGEARHYKHQSSAVSGIKGKSRDSVYMEGAVYTLSQLAMRTANVTPLFAHNVWGSSYGGWPWFNASVQCMKLYNRMSAMQWQQALEEANKLLTMAHNGGWLLNKFIAKQVMDHAAGYPGWSMARAVPRLWQIVTWSGTPVTLKPRQFRAAAGWKLDGVTVAPVTKTVSLKVDGKTWKPLLWNKDGQANMRAAVEEV